MTRYLIIYAKRYGYKADKTNVYDMVIANIIFESTGLVLDHICLRSFLMRPSNNFCFSVYAPIALDNLMRNGYGTNEYQNKNNFCYYFM